MAYKVFTNGSVLNASEINENLMNQAVMVFSNSTTRAAALTAPVEGMLTWLEDVNRYEHYNGSSWVTTIPTVEVPGLRFIKTQTIGTAVSSVVVSDAFSSTYDNYRVIISGGSGSATNDISLRFGAAATGYYGSTIRVTTGGAGTFTGQANTAALEIGRFTTGTNQPAIVMDILSPFLAQRTTVNSSSVFADNSAGALRTISGYLNDTGSYTAFTLIPTSPTTITGGTIEVYGYRKS